MSEYADRDIIAQGGYYLRHVSAMTAERLHEKSDIAAELAHRDQEIDRLRAERDAARALLREARPCVYLYATWSNEHVETMRLLDRIDAATKDSNV